MRLVLDHVGLIGQDASVIAVKVGEQTSPVVLEIVIDSVVVLLEFLVKGL